MSGYPEDFRPNDPRTIEMARSVVTPPGILLILVGFVTALLGGFLLAALPHMPASFDEAVAQMEADPAKTDDEKKEFRRQVDDLKKLVENGTLTIVGVIILVSGLLAIVGGIRLMTVSGVVLPMIGAIAVMTPFTVSLCCLIGLPIGIWVIVAANRPIVRMAIAARRSPVAPTDPDDQYMR